MKVALNHLRWFAPYAASILLTKGMAIISIPLITAHLSPDEYGRLELTLSFVEVAGLALSFAAADALFRLGADGGPEHARTCARALTGLVLSLAIGMGLMLQTLVWVFSNSFVAIVDPALLAIGLASASLSGLIELPLAWIRFTGRAHVFLAFVGARSTLQIIMMWSMLSSGYGAWGLLLGNLCVDAGAAILLLLLQWRETGIGLDRPLATRAARYAGPLMIGGFSMFALGACDRWFLAGVVTPADIAQYALAGKIAWAVSLAMQPFGLWWYPQRLAVLQKRDGFARSADAVLVGFGFLCAGAVGVATLAPLAFMWLLPDAYAPALALLPAMITIAVLHESCSLMNVGAFAGRTGLPPLIVNTSGAAVAVAGYVVLTPDHGVAGAIAATILAHIVRLAMFVGYGRTLAPVPYHGGAMCVIAMSAACAVLAPHGLSASMRFTSGLGALAVISLAAAYPLLRRRSEASKMIGAPIANANGDRA